MQVLFFGKAAIGFWILEIRHTMFVVFVIYCSSWKNRPVASTNLRFNVPCIQNPALNFLPQYSFYVKKQQIQLNPLFTHANNTIL